MHEPDHSLPQHWMYCIGGGREGLGTVAGFLWHCGMSLPSGKHNVDLSCTLWQPCFDLCVYTEDCRQVIIITLSWNLIGHIHILVCATKTCLDPPFPMLVIWCPAVLGKGVVLFTRLIARSCCWCCWRISTRILWTICLECPTYMHICHCLHVQVWLLFPLTNWHGTKGEGREEGGRRDPSRW